MKVKHGPYSPSRLETGLCGRAFKFQYVDKKQRPQSTLPQDRGSALHEVLEHMTKTLCAAIPEDGGEPEDVIFRPDQVREWVTDAVNRFPAAYEDTGEILRMAKLFAERPPEGLTHDAGIEMNLAVKWNGSDWEECGWDDPDAFFRGKADIMVMSDCTTRAVVYDHKTQMNTEEADTFQMGAYAWVISKIYPFLDEISTVLHFARYGFYSDPYVWTKEELAKIEDEILTRVQIIETREDWRATPHHKCMYCPLIADCPSWQEYLEVEEDGSYRVLDKNFKVLDDTSKAVKLAGAVNVMEEFIKNGKAALREYVKNTGPVAIPGKIFEFRGKEEINWNKVNKPEMREQVYEIFMRHGVDPKMFMSFNQSASKSIWMTENEALVKELSEKFPRKLTTSFGGYKP